MTEAGLREIAVVTPELFGRPVLTHDAVVTISVPLTIRHATDGLEFFPTMV